MRQVIGDASISVRVVDGESVVLPRSENPITAVINGELTEQSNVSLDPSRKYVIGQITSSDASSGKRLYIVDLLVRNGPLKGAIIHLRSGELQRSPDGPLLAVFEIPEGLELANGVMEFDVIGLKSK